ncbi:hypothetical protein Hanom_Chr05g00412621 [Helianthus anomalus]
MVTAVRVRYNRAVTKAVPASGAVGMIVKVVELVDPGGESRQRRNPGATTAGADQRVCTCVFV